MVLLISVKRIVAVRISLEPPLFCNYIFFPLQKIGQNWESKRKEQNFADGNVLIVSDLLIILDRKSRL